jgi:MFS transporter, DHA2 family, multidrug resistance protein
MSQTSVSSANPVTVSEWKPRVNPWLIAAAVMLATILEVLDTSVANVALPNIAGNLSASTDEATWVLTSYLVANAIVLPMTGWLSSFFGRKRFLIGCIAIFTLASAACGMASSLGLLILARVLQGAAGGALQPLSQAVLMESFPPAKRGSAMAIFGLGVVVAPIVGPVLGGWITDNYSWRWIFYINVPLGVLAVLMSQAFLEDPPYLREAHERRGGRVDFLGFAVMAIWLATLQIVLDRGQQDDWFSAAWIRWAAGISLATMILFILRELTTEHPLVNLQVLANRNFAVGTLLITIVGIVLYSTTALLPMFLQSLMNYPALQSGMAISPRGVGAIVTLLIVGRLVGVIDSRILIATGFSLLAYSCWVFGRITLDMSTADVMWPNILSGMGMACIFVPLTTSSMGSLPREEMGNAAGLFNLARNIGGGIGISLTTTLVARGTQAHQAMAVAHLSPYKPAFQQYLQKTTAALAATTDPVGAAQQAHALVYGTLLQQANLCAYVDTFRLMTLMCLACVPVVLLLRRTQAPKGPVAAH